jgi:flagellar M-ring protein FliF
MYKPNSPPEPQAIRSQQSSESRPAPERQPVAACRARCRTSRRAWPPRRSKARPTAGQQATTGPSSKNATTNYEVDKTVRYEQKPMGGIKRLTVGVVVNYRRSVDPKPPARSWSSR